MLFILALVLFVLWLFGVIVINVSSWLIHLLIIAAVIVILYKLLFDRRRV